MKFKFAFICMVFLVIPLGAMTYLLVLQLKDIEKILVIKETNNLKIKSSAIKNHILNQWKSKITLFNSNNPQALEEAFINKNLEKNNHYYFHIKEEFLHHFKNADTSLHKKDATYTKLDLANKTLHIQKNSSLALVLFKEILIHADAPHHAQIEAIKNIAMIYYNKKEWQSALKYFRMIKGYRKLTETHIFCSFMVIDTVYRETSIISQEEEKQFIYYIWKSIFSGKADKNFLLLYLSKFKNDFTGHKPETLRQFNKAIQLLKNYDDYQESIASILRGSKKEAPVNILFKKHIISYFKTNDNAINLIFWDSINIKCWVETFMKENKTHNLELKIISSDNHILYQTNESSSKLHTFTSETLFQGAFAGWRVQVSIINESAIFDSTKKYKFYFMLFLSILIFIILIGIFILYYYSIKLSEVGKMKEDFASSVSHELKTPLAMIQASAESLINRSDINESKKLKYLKIIFNESFRLNSLLSNILNFSKIDKKSHHLKFKNSNINEVIVDVINSYQDFIGEKGFVIRTDLQNKLTANIDQEAFALVLINLIDNAIKFSVNIKEIQVKTFSENKKIAIEIIDQGVGIDQKYHQKVFQNFYRIPDAKVKTKGTGIGLTIVRDIIKAHQGHITIESQLDHGTTIKIQLPSTS